MAVAHGGQGVFFKKIKMSEKLRKFKLLSWNVRGLGCLKKCDVVRNVIRESRCDIVILQETKWNDSDLIYYLRTLPSFFNRNCVVLHANNSAGGLLIAWKHGFHSLNSWATRNSVSVLLQQSSSGAILLVTNVYGPTTDTLKPAFINELRYLSSLATNPWILGGDFNLVRWLIDRSGNQRNFTLMSLFNDLIREMEVIDIPLQNRKFTWCSNRPDPSHSRIDRILIAPELSLQFPLITMQAMEVLVSDHAPLLLSCRKPTTPKRLYKMELFWLSNPQATAIIQEIWSNGDRSLNELQRFSSNCERMHKRLRDWHCHNFDDIEKQMQFCKKTVLFFDQIEEQRKLESYEYRFRIMVKERAYALAGIIEARWHHRFRCRWLKAGDKNTRYFHAVASARQRRNKVSFIKVHDVIITEEGQIRDAFKTQMEELLGVEGSVLQFQADKLYPNNPDLSFLDHPFSEIEVERAVRQLAKNKASGPYGIPNELLQKHWPLLKDEVLLIVQDFYNHTLNLEEANQANIIMIPKKEFSE